MKGGAAAVLALRAAIAAGLTAACAAGSGNPGTWPPEIGPFPAGPVASGPAMPALVPADPVRPGPGQGTLVVAVRWPSREAPSFPGNGPGRATQLIPLGAETIRLRVFKDGAMLGDLPLSRPSQAETSQDATASFRLDAATGLTVLAEAFRESPVTSGSVPIATASAESVAVAANQRTRVLLDLAPSFVPALARFTPSSGGPGAHVTLEGTFGDSGWYGMRIGEAFSAGWASGDAIVAPVPPGASSGPVVALADGVPSAPFAAFRVLSALVMSPGAATVSLGATASFAVPEGLDTGGTPVGEPALTRWEVVDPASPYYPYFGLAGPSPVGTVTEAGVFLALATGDAVVRAWSGSIVNATAAVTVVE